MMDKVREFRQRLVEKLDDKISITTRSLALSIASVLLFFTLLSGVSPFWLRRLIGVESRVVFLPEDPDNRMGWAVHSEAYEEKLFERCRELQDEGVAAPKPVTPTERRVRRKRR